MKLKDYILQQLEAMKDMMIMNAEFIVCLDSNGMVVESSMNTIKFTLTLR